MANIDRRTFLRATTSIAAGALAPELRRASTNNREFTRASPSPSTPPVTKTLASYMEQIRKLIGLCWGVEKLSNPGDIAKAAVPA